TIDVGLSEDATHHISFVKFPLLFSVADHQASYLWYTTTVNDLSNFERNGFYNSPFESHWPSTPDTLSPGNQQTPRVMRRALGNVHTTHTHSGDAGSFRSQGLSDFTTFGDVTI